MEYVNARWMWSPRGFVHGIEWIMFHGHLNYSQKPPLGNRPNTKPGDHGTPNAHDHWFILFLSCVRDPTWIEFHWNNIWLRTRSRRTSHYTWGSWPNHMMLEVCWDGLWTLSFGISQFHGHGSWLMCEVALRCKTKDTPKPSNLIGWGVYTRYWMDWVWEGVRCQPLNLLNS
jgi:hypothetical protein